MSNRKLPTRPQSAELFIEQIALDQLVVDPRNPRKHSSKQIAQLGKSMEQFGFNTPILIDATNTIVAGHARVQACRQLGWTAIPAIRLSHLSKAQAKAYMLADNKLAENATWDTQLLGEVLHELSVSEFELSLDVTGFEIGEIDVLIEAAKDRGKATAIEQDVVPGLSPGPAVSELGDLWQLGPHRVLCGSALDASSYVTLLGDERAAMVFTDPPYNVPIKGHVSGREAAREFVMASGEMSTDDFVGFLAASLGHHARHSQDGSLHFVCMDWRHMGELLQAGSAARHQLKNVCVWTKDNAGMGSLYRSQHEMVFVFKQGGAGHRNNVQLGKHGRNRSNVWSYPGATSFSRNGNEGNLLALHPTVKPVQLVSDAILDCTARGDLVLDGFLGSGTTLIAAERVGRVCCGLELDPRYMDVIITRWQALTGAIGRHVASGQTWAERQAIKQAESGTVDSVSTRQQEC